MEYIALKNISEGISYYLKLNLCVINSIFDHRVIWCNGEKKILKKDEVSFLRFQFQSNIGNKLCSFSQCENYNEDCDIGLHIHEGKRNGVFWWRLLQRHIPLLWVPRRSEASTNEEQTNQQSSQRSQKTRNEKVKDSSSR